MERKAKRVLIVYHGTNWVNAKKILAGGFKEGTYFSIHLEDALGYGGGCVFEVAYPVFLIPKRCWQFRTQNGVLPEFIVRLTKYNQSRIIYDDMVLRSSVCISNSTRAETKYITNNMKTHPSRYAKAELTAYRVEKIEASNLGDKR